MRKKKWKRIKMILLVSSFIVMGLFVANWYLKYRLETYLKQMLSEKVSESTDGFYKLSFDTLSIGLFNGQLLLKGVDFEPDSVVFKEQLAKDSLPDTYMKIRVGSINFKGVNLTWRFNYKKLDFDLFEIKNADVEVYDSQLANKNRKKPPRTSQTLYEMISPYINVLHVRRINLENSNVLYVTDDGGTPTHYGLEDINFHAYDFLLDANSAESGKLLYCDNFDFEANKPQALLSNSQFTLTTDQILLNTQDSLVQIRGIDLIPQKELWKKVKQIPDNYVEAAIKTIDIRGIQFIRENALNELDARLFEIGSSDIEYFSMKKDSVLASKIDTIDFSWSLYSILSPIFHKVSIENIDIDDAKFKYSQRYNEGTNVYTLDELQIRATNFLVDSVSESNMENTFLHSEYFALRAKGINGITPEKNYKFSIDQMMINTNQKKFRVKNIALEPISTNSKHDYVSGSIESIDIDSLIYNNGIEVAQLKINTPVIEYVKVPRMKKETEKKTHANDDKGNSAWAQILPIFNHLLVRNINLNNGNIAYIDNDSKNRYKVSNLDFFAKNIFVDENVVDSLGYLSVCDDFGFDFNNFDSYLSHKQYRLQIRNASFNKKRGRFRLRNIELTPQVNSWKTAPDTYAKVSIPSVDIKGINLNVVDGEKNLEVGSFDLIAPKIQIVKANLPKGNDIKQAEAVDKVLSNVISGFHLGSLNLKDAEVTYLDKTVKDSTQSSIQSLQLKSFTWHEKRQTRIDEIILKAPQISMVKHNASPGGSSKVKEVSSSSLSDYLLNGLSIGKFEISNMRTSIVQPDMKMNFDVEEFDLSNLEWGQNAFNLGAVNVYRPLIEVNSTTKPKPDEPKGNQKSSNDFYDVLGRFSKHLTVKDFNVTEANVDYNHVLKDVPSKHQKLNETNLHIKGLVVDNIQKTYSLDDVNANTKDFHFPLDDGFYTVRIDNILLDKQKAQLKLDNVALIPAYPKEEFAYRQPKHKDWFDVTVGSVSLSGIDLPKYFSTKELHADNLQVDKVVLQNFKNQKIEIEHNVMPMIYQGLQDLPLKLSVTNADVTDFSVIYEELPKNGNVASKIFFTDMNGHLKGLTNIVSRPDQFIELDADGKLMGSGYFTATWMIPVAKNNDCFILDAQLNRFDLRELNQLVTPMAPVRIEGGIVKDVTFKMEASSLGGSIDMLMLYNGLALTIQKSAEDTTQNKLYTKIANKVLKANNPDKPNSKPREVHALVTRDPYHSTFNYLWQILQPPLVESVGISQGKQNFMRKVSGIVAKVKGFFGKGKKKKEKDKNEMQEVGSIF